MPPPSSENDLKRRARRRLIGAVALTLLAVIVLPLLLEDAPPPAGSLTVRMPPAETPASPPEAEPEAEPEAKVAAVQPVLPEPAPEPKPHPKPEPKPELSRPATPVVAPPEPAMVGVSFVVQLAALSDPAKVQTLRARASASGFPVFTDTLGSLTRVRVGPFATREAAEAARKKLADAGMSGQVVAK